MAIHLLNPPVDSDEIAYLLDDNTRTDLEDDIGFEEELEPEAVEQRYLDEYSQAMEMERKKNLARLVVDAVDPDIIAQELALIEAAAGKAASPLKGPGLPQAAGVDYSLFRTKGHYTKNIRLAAYYKVMMWYKAMIFPLEPESPEQTRLTLILTRLIMDDPGLLKKYSWLNTVLDYFAGRTTDHTPLTYAGLLDRFTGFPAIADLADDELLMQFIAQAEKEVPVSPADGNLNPGAFRFMGERAVLDDRLRGRLARNTVDWHSGTGTWDLPGVLGSTWTEQQLAGHLAENGRYAEKYNETKEMFVSMSEQDWQYTFYQSYLGALRSLLLFPGNTGIPWFDSPAYLKKNHLAFLGTHTGLKQNTFMYAFYLYSHDAWSPLSEVEYQFVKDPLPAPRGYVEPNLPFFRNILASNNQLAVSPAGDLMLDSSMGENWTSFMAEVYSLYLIVKKQVTFKTISRAEYDSLLALPQKLALLAVPPGVADSTEYINIYWTSDNFGYVKNDYRMALVTDIYTDGGSGEVLTLGTGIPNRIYMPVFDPSGGRRLCVGYTFSYHEFWQPVSGRLDQDQWKTIVYDPGQPGSVKKELD